VDYGIPRSILAQDSLRARLPSCEKDHPRAKIFQLALLAEVLDLLEVMAAVHPVEFSPLAGG
jgi:hypothetical protein